VCCSVLQCGAVCCSVLQCVAVCCSVLQCVAVCCSVLQCVVVFVNICEHVSQDLSQCVAVCCSVLQCVAVCCSVLHCVALCNSLCDHVWTCVKGLSICEHRPQCTWTHLLQCGEDVNAFITGWPWCNSQVSFRKRATNFRKRATNFITGWRRSERICYSVARMHRLPGLYRSFPAKEPCN